MDVGESEEALEFVKAAWSEFWSFCSGLVCHYWSLFSSIIGSQFSFVSFHGAVFHKSFFTSFIAHSLGVPEGNNAVIAVDEAELRTFSCHCEVTPFLVVCEAYSSCLIRVVKFINDVLDVVLVDWEQSVMFESAEVTNEGGESQQEVFGFFITTISTFAIVVLFEYLCHFFFESSSLLLNFVFRHFNFNNLRDSSVSLHRVKVGIKSNESC